MSKPSFRWPLSISSFTVLDKLRIGLFLLTEPMWTYGKWVRAYEEMWEKEFGVKHAIMVSSGSAANELIALRRKWELQLAGDWPRRNKVVVPVNTWISSVSVWINLGFEPVFVDVSPHNANVTAEGLYDVLLKDPNGAIGTVFYTALLGFFGDIEECKSLAEAHGARFLMDNCEASFSFYSPKSEPAQKSLLTFTTNSTSVFFSHFTSSGTEGGFIFTESQEEAEWYRMARSHGLTRGMPEKYRNPEVNPEFDFYLLGSNYRSSNLQAYMAMLDFKRALKFSLKKRREIFHALNSHLDSTLYFRFEPGPVGAANHYLSVPLAIPIICKTKERRLKVEVYLKATGVMTRPLIGGCLLAHTAFAGYGDMEDFPIAKHLHDSALYIGLHKDVTPALARQLARELNDL